jgi:integrase
MGTIVTRKRKNGTSAHMAKIIIKRDGAVVHRESKTFERRPAAAAWIAKREEELSQPGKIELANSPRITLRQVIETYQRESVKPIRRTKGQVLEAIKRLDIAGKFCDQIASHDLVAFARELAHGRSPSTVGNYISHLSAIFDVAAPAWNYPLDKQAMADAMVVMRRLGLIGKSNLRDRRPTLDELDRIMTYFAGRKASAAPMLKITAFAIFSTRREEEITRITWDDLDEEHSRVLVRDMKNPTEKAGNDVWCDLVPEALAIIRAMPRNLGRIFPYLPDTIGSAWREACHIKGVDDLRFHDLRHDGVSRLFELGWNIPHVAAVSGHRSWQSLKRYTHIRQRGDKYAGWKWLEIATRP